MPDGEAGQVPQDVAEKPLPTKRGDLYRFGTKINGQIQMLVGRVEQTFGSAEARRLGYIQTKRSGIVLGLRVNGFKKLFWKQKGQCKRYKGKVD